MKTPWLMIALTTVALGLGGCNRAESPSEVQEDVADAQQDAAEQVIEEQREAQLGDTVTPEDNREILVAKAEGEHKVAIERCESLAGDAQEACKEQADADLERAKAEAKANTTAGP